MTITSREHLRATPAVTAPFAPLTMLEPGRRCEEKGCLGGPTLLSRYNRETTCEACKQRHKAAREKDARDAEEARAERTIREALLEAMPGMSHELMERTGVNNSTFYKTISKMKLRGEVISTGERGRGGRGRDALGGYVYHRAEAAE